MKKAVISTFNNSDNNYGALFQACALSSFLQKLGYDAYNVTILNRSTAAKSKKTKLKLLMKRVLLLPKKSLIDKRKQKCRQFAKDTQKQLVYNNLCELHNNPPKADIYISGSDQVWNPVLIHDDFFLNYAPEGTKKISYAASMGHETIPKKNEKIFADYIAAYDSISVREDNMIPIISKYTDKEIFHNIDPVFLKTREEWSALAQPYKNLKYDKYILVYAIEWSDAYNHQLKELKKKTSLPVISLNMGNIKKISADQVIYDSSPNEFLYLLSKAEYVVSTSFHGTAMSVIYNKKFMIFSGNDKPTRIESLFRYLGINSRNSVDNAIREIDYDRVNSKIAMGVKEAYEYIYNSIEKHKEHYN